MIGQLLAKAVMFLVSQDSKTIMFPPLSPLLPEIIPCLLASPSIMNIVN